MGVNHPLLQFGFPRGEFQVHQQVRKLVQGNVFSPASNNVSFLCKKLKQRIICRQLLHTTEKSGASESSELAPPSASLAPPWTAAKIAPGFFSSFSLLFLFSGVSALLSLGFFALPRPVPLPRDGMVGLQRTGNTF